MADSRHEVKSDRDVVLFRMKRERFSLLSGIRTASIAVFASILVLTAYAQETMTPGELKELSLEELMNLEVTSVSRAPEKLTETASAIQAVTGGDIHKYGATSIPEALYLAGNLQVAQKPSHSWGISARGFNTDLANKLLVLFDGRSIYTPLYSGVFWERQDYLMEDISRIEVISGPGGTLWGANAVNGIINIISKKASETQGVFAEAGWGTELQRSAGARYGGKIGDRVYYRVYAKYFDRDGSVLNDTLGTDIDDDWGNIQGGFRIDAEPSEKNTFTFQGDLYRNTADQVSGGEAVVTAGNLLGKWQHNISEGSNLSLQAYYDHTFFYDSTPALFSAPRGLFKDDLSTYDMDFQHRIGIGQHHFVWGAGYRHTTDNVTNAPALGFFPSTLNQDLFSLFAQDEFSLTSGIALTLGSKLEHNDYTGFEFEPNARVTWNVGERHMIWGAVSRAVRTPSRVDRDISEPIPPYYVAPGLFDQVLLVGGEDFRSETVLSDELGYRGQFGGKVSTSLSLFYNHYDHIRSTLIDSTTIFPLYFRNGLEAETYGFEFTLAFQPLKWWLLQGSWNALRESLWLKPGEQDYPNNKLLETADPDWQFSIRSSFNITKSVSLHGALRRVDALRINDTPYGTAGVPAYVAAYTELDLRAGWYILEHFELSVQGRNLLHDHHAEYFSPSPARAGIERCVFVALSGRF